LVDYRIGTEIVALNQMKIKFSYKDLLLILGILVAVVITLTTLVHIESRPEAAKTTPVPKTSLNANPAVVIQQLLKKVDLNSFPHP
jgi:hypothetical protein